MPKRPRRVQPVFYVIPSIILGVTLILSILPLFSEAATFIYDAGFLTIIYALLSLSIALYLFGFLGDSAAIAQSDQHGLKFQVGGSAAGALIFFYFFSSGLNPYRDLTIYLLDGTKEAKPQLTSADGNVDLTIATNIQRKYSTQEGIAYFRDLPRSEDWRLLLGQNWQVKSAEPAGCWKVATAEISRKCSKIYLELTHGAVCLKDQAVNLNEKTSTRVNLANLLEPFGRIMDDQGVRLKISYSPQRDRVAVNANAFEVFRHHSARLGACELLEEIEDIYNSNNPQQPIKIFASCDAIYVSDSQGTAPSKEYESCE